MDEELKNLIEEEIENLKSEAKKIWPQIEEAKKEIGDLVFNGPTNRAKLANAKELTEKIKDLKQKLHDTLKQIREFREHYPKT